MRSTLPRHPNLDILRKQAKDLLVAHRRGAPVCCAFLRRIRRLSSLDDRRILEVRVSLTDAQLAVALQYGFPSWKDLCDEARSYPPDAGHSLASALAAAEEPVPEYAGAGVPLAVVAAMNHAGVPVRFMEFVAASGWAFSFGYDHADASPAFMAVRGEPGSDGPLEVFSFLPRAYGLGYEMARTSEPDEVWRFVKRRVETGTPVMSEHMDGGLITAWRTKGARRQVFFDGAVSPGWIDVEGMQPFAVYALVREREPRSPASVVEEALRRAVAKASSHEWEGVPQGLAALRRYLDDVRDPEKDFSAVPEWFCWAAFERLMARRCAAVWLRAVAGTRSGHAREGIEAAASRYDEAFDGYRRYLAEVRGPDPVRITLEDRTRTPDRIAVLAPILERAIAAEEAGLRALEDALAVPS